MGSFNFKRFINKKVLTALFFTSLCNSLIFSQGQNGFFSQEFIRDISFLTLSIGVIIFISQSAGYLFKNIRLPQILGELIAGLIISPYLLGSFLMPWFNQNFSVSGNAGSMLSDGLFFFSLLSCIIILFMLGLETDLSALNIFKGSGAFIGITGSVLSFIVGLIFGSYFFKTRLFDISSIFLGFITSATSIGIISSILRDNLRINFKERNTLYSSIIIDNIFTVFSFIVVLSFLFSLENLKGRETTDLLILFNFFKNLILWAVPVIIILIAVMILERVAYKFKNFDIISMITIGLVILVTGIFIKFSISLIICAYLAGLLLSKTNFNFALRENSKPIFHLLSPVFYVYIGMLTDLKIFFDKPELIWIGSIFVLLVIAAKIFGNLIPSIILKPDFKQSMRISIGMIPRFEFVLIIGFIGYAMNKINVEIFTILSMLVIFSSIISIILYNLSIRKQDKIAESETRKDKDSPFILKYQFETSELNRLLISKLIENFRNQGFSINSIVSDQNQYQLNKDDLFLDMACYENSLSIETSNANIAFVNTFVYDTINDLNKDLNKGIQPKDKIKNVEEKAADKIEIKKTKFEIKDILSKENIIMNLKAETKSEVFEEMAAVLYKNGHITNLSVVVDSLIEREKIMSTGMQQGVAIPHCKTKAVDKMVMAVGIKKDGINFEAIDNKPSKIFIMLIAPEGPPGPHLHALMLISSIIINEEARNKLLNFTDKEDIWKFLAVSEKKA